MLDKMDVLEKPTEVRSDMRIRLEPRITSGNDVLTVEHLSKAFPGQTLFQDLNFEIKRGERVARLRQIQGMIPNPHDMPAGCAFAPRCDDAWDLCRSRRPEPRWVEGRRVACHKWTGGV